MKNKTLLWTIGGVATAVLAYFLFAKGNKKTTTFGDVDDTQELPTRETVTSAVSSAFPLKRGSRGENVKSLQRFLISEGYSIGSFGENKDGVDGIFGQMTESAVRKNQLPFAVFKSMYPTAIEGQVSKEFFDLNIKGKY